MYLMPQKTEHTHTKKECDIDKENKTNNNKKIDIPSDNSEHDLFLHKPSWSLFVLDDIFTWSFLSFLESVANFSKCGAYFE